MRVWLRFAPILCALIALVLGLNDALRLSQHLHRVPPPAPARAA